VLIDIELTNAKARRFCWQCRQPIAGCYCAQARSFDPMISFAVLIHKIESRRRIATGRMSHLLLKQSLLIEGDCFENNNLVNSLIENPSFFPVVLYPGVGAVDLSKLAPAEQGKLFSTNRRLLVFVIDGTWATARRTMRLSSNLAKLPRVCFSPTRESQFKVRKQPAVHCVSTIEAIHQTIELLGESQGFEVSSRVHDHLLDVFAQMVERQSSFLPISER
jgi:DTW domain-containing protein YfiP